MIHKIHFIFYRITPNIYKRLNPSFYQQFPVLPILYFKTQQCMIHIFAFSHVDNPRPVITHINISLRSKLIKICLLYFCKIKLIACVFLIKTCHDHVHEEDKRDVKYKYIQWQPNIN